MHINDNIKKARILRKFTQDEISSKLGEKRSTYAEWEKETIPRADIFWNIAAVLGFRPDELMQEKWEPDENSSSIPIENGIHQKKPSLETIQKALDRVLKQQHLARADIRAFGEYHVMKDAGNNKAVREEIMEQINRLVALNLGVISKEDSSSDENN